MKWEQINMQLHLLLYEHLLYEQMLYKFCTGEDISVRPPAILSAFSPRSPEKCNADNDSKIYKLE